jgi:hypothetical protein
MLIIKKPIFLAAAFAVVGLAAFWFLSYQNIRFDDLRDLFAYPKTLPPVQGRVRDHELPFPFNFRRPLPPVESQPLQKSNP